MPLALMMFLETPPLGGLVRRSSLFPWSVTRLDIASLIHCPFTATSFWQQLIRLSLLLCSTELALSRKDR